MQSPESYIVDLLNSRYAREWCCTQEHWRHVFFSSLSPSLSPLYWRPCSRDVVCSGKPCVHVLLSSQSLVAWALGWEPPSWCLISIVNDPPLCPAWVSDGLLTDNTALVSKTISPIWSAWQFPIPVKYISIQSDPAESQCRLEISNVSLCSVKDTTVYSDEWPFEAVALSLTDAKCTRLKRKSVELLQYLVAFWPSYMFQLFVVECVIALTLLEPCNNNALLAAVFRAFLLRPLSQQKKTTIFYFPLPTNIP